MKHRAKSPLPLVILPALLLALRASLAAGPLVLDSFKDAVAEGPDTVTSAMTWRKIHNTTLDMTTGDTHGGGNALLAVIGQNGRLGATFPATTLEPGDSLRVSLRMRFVEPPRGDARLPFRMAVENVADPENPGNAGDPAPGYVLFTQPDKELPEGSSFAFEDGTDGSMGGGADFVSLGKAFASVDLGTSLHTVEVLITVEDSGVELSYEIDGAKVGSAFDPDKRLTTFNLILLAIIGDPEGATIAVENATVTLNSGKANP